MIDTTTSKPLKVSKYGNARPFVSVPVSRIGALRQLFDKHQINYTVDEYAISFNGKPETVFVFLDDEVEVTRLQAILDAAG